MTRANFTVNCPRCAKPVSWGAESPFRPFCSERCKMIDLGAWASEEYRVAVEDKAEDAAARPVGSKSDAP